MEFVADNDAIDNDVIDYVFEVDNEAWLGMYAVYTILLWIMCMHNVL